MYYACFIFLLGITTRLFLIQIHRKFKYLIIKAWFRLIFNNTILLEIRHDSIISYIINNSRFRCSFFSDVLRYKYKIKHCNVLLRSENLSTRSYEIFPLLMSRRARWCIHHKKFNNNVYIRYSDHKKLV